MSSLLHSPFLARAGRAPGSVAVRDANEVVTYGELERASRRVATGLIERGVRVGDRVALLLPKSPTAIAVALGILRSGAAYVPIDDQSPPARRRAILADAAPRLLVTTGTALGALREGARETDGELPAAWLLDPSRGLHAELAASPDGPTSVAPPEVHPGEPAYVLYTSGSTGVPKGVMVSHEGAAAFVDWAIRAFAITATDRLTSFAELAFDLSVLDVYAALGAGASVLLIPRDLMIRPGRVVELLATAGITLAYAVPSTYSLLEAAGDLARRAPPTLTRLLYAGEPFPVPRLRRLMSALPGARVHNLFGPTETNVCLAHALPPELPRDATAVPIGRPCDHLSVALLDREGIPVADGEEGELCVGGPSVMLGYLGQPAASRATFWPPNAAGDGPARYRTGDHARRDPNGDYWFVGRRDRMVKHRGYRIELGEVEAALGNLPGVRESAVTTRSDGRGGLEIVAHVVPEFGVEFTVLSVKAHCGRHLPPYMVPAFVELLPALPRTTTGKVDLLHLR